MKEERSKHLFSGVKRETLGGDIASEEVATATMVNVESLHPSLPSEDK